MEPRHADLERIIAENPDDDNAWAVYLDWLIAQGHPRGALGRVQMLCEKSPEEVQLREQEEALLADHRDVIRGHLEGSPYTLDGEETTYRRGFWWSVRFGGSLRELVDFWNMVDDIGIYTL